MSPKLPSFAVPEALLSFPEPVSAEETAWVSEAAWRLAPAGGLAELQLIARILQGEQVGDVPMALDTVVEPRRVQYASSESASVHAAADPVAETPTLSASIDQIAEPSPCIAEVEPADLPAEPASAGADPACTVSGAMPLFPRSASQRRRGGKFRKRAPLGSEIDDASMQLVLPLAQPVTPRVAVGQFADRLSRARAQLMEEASETTVAPCAEVLSFADRLKKVRERLADEDAAPGRISA